MAPTARDDAAARCLFVNERAVGSDLFPSPKRELHAEQNCAWRISPDPFWIDRETLAFFEKLGDSLLAFYQASNLLYQHSHRGLQPAWVSEYLDRGKPERVRLYGLMNRFKSDVPAVIRPDVILTPEGPAITELDSIPGGIGLLGFLNDAYTQLGFDVVGGPNGMITGFAEALLGLARPAKPVLGIVVSDEGADYRPEMTWLGERLRERGVHAHTIRPDDVFFAGDHLYVDGAGGREHLDVIYRFFELFDLKNISQIDLILYAIRKEAVAVTPPLKSYLEEKLLLGFLHHPKLEGFWQEELGDETLTSLKTLVPETWIMDSSPVPPYAVIPGLELEGEPVSSWSELKEATKSQRRLVVKPSGFSELAWGSHGVHIGHDMSSKDWAEAIDEALASFDTGPYVLQRFHKGTKYELRYYDFWEGEVKSVRGRVRMTPFYFVSAGHARLGGIMATAAPLNKKLIHGMTEAIMAPVAVRDV